MEAASAIHTERHKGQRELHRALLLCSPADAYKNMSELEAARAYTKFAIEDYDKLVTFAPSYDPSKFDLRQLIGNKEKRDIYETIFAEQPVVRIGNVRGSMRSTSYLFNPECSLEGDLLLPDLDAIELYGPPEVDTATAKIKEFYEKAGWKVEMATGRLGELPREHFDADNKDRFPRGLEVLSPAIIVGLAENTVGYNREKLCFRTEK
jgi:hypothetical protein